MAFQKTSTPGYMKDPNTGAVINTATTEYQVYLAHRAKILSNKELSAKVDKLETDITEIKNLLLQIVKPPNV